MLTKGLSKLRQKELRECAEIIKLLAENKYSKAAFAYFNLGNYEIVYDKEYEKYLVLDDSGCTLAIRNGKLDIWIELPDSGMTGYYNELLLEGIQNCENEYTNKELKILVHYKEYYENALTDYLYDQFLKIHN